MAATAFQTGPALVKAFTSAASSYWLGVFPHVGCEVRRWRRRASEIPDPGLRRLALLTHSAERGNLDGAAAFAILVPRAHRQRVVRAVVAFQATYDYVDTLAEQPSADPAANGAQLHAALTAALDPCAEHADYYAHHDGAGDDGYMRSLIDTCRDALGGLPSYGAVAEPALASAKRMAAYQSFNHRARGEAHHGLVRWASALTPPGSDMRWWEAAAGAASSLTIFALVAAAARPALTQGETDAVQEAYFPWIGALHVLLDGLVDRAEDRHAGQRSLLEHYASSDEAASRLKAIAARAMLAAEALSQGGEHALIVAAMTSFYLSAPSASTAEACLAARAVREATGIAAAPTMAVFALRRAAGRLLGGVLPRDH
jgi:tetraprenyl-beta-curcumene synthase